MIKPLGHKLCAFALPNPYVKPSWWLLGPPQLLVAQSLRLTGRSCASAWQIPSHSEDRANTGINRVPSLSSPRPASASPRRTQLQGGGLENHPQPLSPSHHQPMIATIIPCTELPTSSYKQAWIRSRGTTQRSEREDRTQSLRTVIASTALTAGLRRNRCWGLPGRSERSGSGRKPNEKGKS